MQILLATLNQLDDLVYLFDQYRVFYRQHSDKTQAKKFLRARLERQESTIFLATKDNKPIGYTQLFPSWSSVSLARVWILNDLYVIPQSRNKGVAKALMIAAQEFAVETKAVRIILATEVTNMVGQNLYESMGYRQFDDFYHYVLNLAK